MCGLFTRTSHSTILTIRLLVVLFTKHAIQVHAVIGVLTDDTDPMVSVMKLEKAPQETYADIGGLDTQIQEIKVCGWGSLDHVTLVVVATNAV